MAFDFKNVYNKAFAEPGTKINKKLNKVIGKEVFQDIKKMEDPKEYPPLSDYPEYDVPEPPQWTLLTGEQKVFPLEGETITISKNLDIWICLSRVHNTIWNDLCFNIITA